MRPSPTRFPRQLYTLRLQTGLDIKSGAMEWDMIGWEGAETLAKSVPRRLVELRYAIDQMMGSGGTSA